MMLTGRVCGSRRKVDAWTLKAPRPLQIAVRVRVARESWGAPPLTGRLCLSRLHFRLRPKGQHWYLLQRDISDHQLSRSSMSF